MDFLQTKRAAHFSDTAAFEQLRAVGESIRQYSLSRLPELLEQLDSAHRAGRAGALGADAGEANAIFLAIAQQHGAGT
jgi:L-lactate dehydrogenase complex protein LldF